MDMTFEVECSSILERNMPSLLGCGPRNPGGEGCPQFLAERQSILFRDLVRAILSVECFNLREDLVVSIRPKGRVPRFCNLPQRAPGLLEFRLCLHRPDKLSKVFGDNLHLVQAEKR